MRIITSWDDGHKLDMKVGELLIKYELMDSIFFIPTIPNQLSIDDIKELSCYFEIGGHTTSHVPDMKKLTNMEAHHEILDNKDWLEDIIGTELEWFCYPRGRYNYKTIEVVKASGYKYARTTWVGHNQNDNDPYRIHPTVHVHRSRKEYGHKNWLAYAIEQYTIAKNKENSYYHIWGHSWEIEEQQLWGELEQLFKHIYGDKDNRGYNHSSEAK